ncbi:hypothetical protein Esti_002185 [Eimeria stiedai]
MASNAHHEASRRKLPQSDDDDVCQTAQIRHSDAFKSFYAGQQLVPAEEWNAFLTCLQSDLPTVFRVVTITPHRHYILRFLKKTMDSLQGGTARDSNDKATAGCGSELTNALKPLQWYKTGNEAFQLDVSRHLLRSSRPLLTLHRLLVAQSKAATIYRQEAVSMIPALFLEKEICGNSIVLDMCAAPGSKTSQLLEALHEAAERERASEALEADGWPVFPSELISIRHSADCSSSSRLVHHLRHLHSPCLLVTSHAAQFFPTVFQPSETAEERGEGCATSASRELMAMGVPPHDFYSTRKTVPKPLTPVLFDGVLCDVPCSGDGTLRKKRSLWASWNAHHGLGCHRLQTLILLRGIKLCRIGSRIVYSTCTFNPIENEAVVHAAITKSRGAVILEDCSNEVPLLKRSPGMSNVTATIVWRVEWEGRWYDSFAEVPKTAKAAKKIRPSMFPPADTEAEDVPLRRCMRFFPHVNNTGGFFVAVMRKIRDVPLTPLANDGSKADALDGVTSGRAASEMAYKEAAPHKRPDCSDCEEDSLATENEGAACSMLGKLQLKRLDQMQLDVACLDWHSDLLEQQNRQIILQAERVARDAREQHLTQGKDDLRGPHSGPRGIASVNCIGQEARSLPLALTRSVTRSVLEQTRELVFRTLSFPEHVLKCRDAPPDLRDLLSGLCSLLCFRLKTFEGCRPADACAPADGEQLEPGERHPKRVYLISKGVKRILESTGCSRYKVISGGCPAFHAHCKGVYRATYGGAQWLASFYEKAMRLIVDQKGALGSSTDSVLRGTLQSGVDDKGSANPVSAMPRRVFRVPSELLYRLVATDQDERRVDLRDVEELPSGQIVSRESSEGPLLFLTFLPPVDGATNLTSTKIAVPAWRGRSNVELMLDRDTRCALKSLMDESGTGGQEQDPGPLEACHV